MEPSPAFVEAALSQALRRARRSYELGNFPVGAVVLEADGRLAGSGVNRALVRGSPIYHAEMEAIARARKPLAAAPPGSLILATTGEPCLMCLGAILNAQAIGTLIWALGPVNPTGSALAAVRAGGYQLERLERLDVIPEPSVAARRTSCALLHRWCVERGDPRAGYFADICDQAPEAGRLPSSRAGSTGPAGGGR